MPTGGTIAVLVVLVASWLKGRDSMTGYWDCRGMERLLRARPDASIRDVAHALESARRVEVPGVRRALPIAEILEVSEGNRVHESTSD